MVSGGTGFLPGADVKSLDLQAGDLDGDDALQGELQGHRGSSCHHLVEGDLGGNGDGGAVGDNDGEGLHAEVVDGHGLGAAVAEAVLEVVGGGQLGKPGGGDRGEGEDQEVHHGKVREADCHRAHRPQLLLPQIRTY